MTMGFHYLYRVLLILAGSHTFHCNVTKDILFVLDSSESIGDAVFYRQMIPVVENVVRFHALKLNPLDTQVGMMAFGGGEHLDIPFSNGTKREFIRTLRNVSFHGGETDLHNALNHVMNHLLTPENGNRANAENVLILMTDGDSTNPLETFTAIDRLKARGVTIYVVVAGCRFHWFNIHQMATNSSYVFTDLHNLSPLLTAYHIWTDICKCQLSSRTDSPHHVFYTGSVAPTAQFSCIDNDNDCELVPKENCVLYRDWAMGSCRKTCGLCLGVTKHTTETPKHTTVTPKPTTLTPKPTTVTPKPTTVTPKPTTVTPRYTITNNCFDVDPICSQFPSTLLCADKAWAFGSCRKTCGLCTVLKYTTPKPTTSTPKLTTTTPKPTTTTPKPTTTTPKPTTTTPKPTTTTPKPTTTTPKPTTTTPKPTTTTPKPTTTTSKPTTTTPKPTTTTPKPTTTTPKPTTTTPKPTTTAPKKTTHRHFFTIRSIMKGKEEDSLLY